MKFSTPIFSFDSDKPSVPVYGALVKEEASTRAGSSSGVGSILENRIEPPIPFNECKKFYKSIGRVQNVTDSFVLDIINRGWYYDDDDKYPEALDLMEQWEEDFDVTAIFESIMRNWILCGVQIISPNDWLPVQLESIKSKIRDKDGKTIEYVQMIKGVETKLDATKFLELPYIDLDREAWGIGMFHSLMYDDYNDIDGKPAKATLEYYRQIIQDESKILHKLGAPRVIYTSAGTAQETIDNDIVPLIKNMKPGDRLILNQALEQVQEEVDGRTRFSESVQHVIAEVDSGMQSSKNRLITEPSAMADAREAGEQDDDRVLGLMEKLRRFMNKEVIPRVTGLQRGEIEFKWGAKDTFDLVLPPAIERAVELGIISPIQAQEILTENFSWKIPEVVEPQAPQEPQPTQDPDMEEKRQLNKEKRLLLRKIEGKLSTI